MPVPLSVVIPVANQPRYLSLLPECLVSLTNQSVWPDEIVLVLDGMTKAELKLGKLPFPVKFFSLPARVGVASAFNTGIAVASQELVLMLGCDDLVKPQAIEQFVSGFVSLGSPDCFMWVDVEWETGEPYLSPCGHGLTTKTFWRWLGGYPLEASGACDSALLAMIAETEWLKHIETTEPMLIVRRDPSTYTGSRDPRWLDIIMQQCALLGQIFRERHRGL